MEQQDRTCTNNCSVVCGECQVFKPMAQTAVDWLVSHWKKLQSEGEKMSWQQIIDITELAKQMEEDINRKSFEAGNKRGWSGYPNTDNWTQPTFEQYYNETYKK